MPLELSEIKEYVAKNIGSFHDKRLDRLDNLKLNNILKRKNPYLFKAKNILNSQDLVKSLLDAYLSSQEEAIFGDFLEGLAIFVCNQVYSGRKSAAEGIDLEFDKDGIRYIVSVKSGPNWGNSSQIKKMKDNFKKAKRILRTSNATMNIIAINGCCYGKDNNPDKGDYHKLCGQRFWEFISGDEDLYISIIKPLENKAKQKNSEFNKEYAKIINRFTYQFSKEFCSPDGEIDWKKLVKFNSGT
ncbi:MAG TPA: PmeII family type II restriction endonuclease [Anaerolineales bacterium]|nr:PmeII family type II restriction endonuclease [Anaerolineales bacterium]